MHLGSIQWTLWLGLFASIGYAPGCVAHPEPPIPAHLETELVVPNPTADQIPDNDLPYLDRISHEGGNWLSDLITLHRRRYGFVQLNVEPLLLEIAQQPAAGELLNHEPAAIRAAVHDGILQARLFDARLRHEPALRGPAPEIEASWVIFERLKMPRPVR